MWYSFWIDHRAKPYAAKRGLGVHARNGWLSVYDHGLFDKACNLLADEIYDTLAMESIEGRHDT